MSAYDIVKHTRDCEKELPSGRVRTSTITTWDVIDTARCSMVSEHNTKREAVAAVTVLEAAALAAAQGAYEAARERGRLEPTAANMAATIAAWDALVAVSPKMKTSGNCASRAGQRQARERQALATRRR